MNTHHHGTAPANGSCCSGKTLANTVGSVIDPVCGMTVDPASTTHHASHHGTDYSFCSAKCCKRFIAEPQKYLSPDMKAVDKGSS